MLSSALISPELSRTLAFGYRDPKVTAQEIFRFSFTFFFDHKKRKKGRTESGRWITAMPHIAFHNNSCEKLNSCRLGFFECKPTVSPRAAAFTFLWTQSSLFPYRFLLPLNCVSQRQPLLWCRILDNKPILPVSTCPLVPDTQDGLQLRTRAHATPPTHRCSPRCRGMQPAQVPLPTWLVTSSQQ